MDFLNIRNAFSLSGCSLNSFRFQRVRGRYHLIKQGRPSISRSKAILFLRSVGGSKHDVALCMSPGEWELSLIVFLSRPLIGDGFSDTGRWWVLMYIFRFAKRGWDHCPFTNQVAVAHEPWRDDSGWRGSLLIRIALSAPARYKHTPGNMLRYGSSSD